MKLKFTLTAAIVCTLAGCAFFDQPLDDLGTLTPAADTDADRAPAQPAPPSPSAPPPLPSASQSSPEQGKESAGTTVSNDGIYFIVSSIFEVPENVPNLSFIHFTERSDRRETAVCEAFLNTHQLTRAADVPSGASDLIIWPVTEGSAPDNCRDMVAAHEPLDISSQTAASVNSNGPYLMSRNSSQQKQMIFDLSATQTGRLATEINEWHQILSSGVSGWQPFIKP